MEKAQNEDTKKSAYEYAYTSNPNEMIINVRYQNRDKLICMFDNSIKKIENGSNQDILTYDNNTLFGDIHLSNSIVKVNKKQTGIFNSEAEIEIRNVNTDKENTYIVSNIPKTISSYDSVIAINLGTEVHFINDSGWLLKKYSSIQEIKDIVISKNIAGIIYKDRIESINL